MTSRARQIFDAHRADAKPGRPAPIDHAPRPDHLLIGPTATAFVLRLADSVLRGSPSLTRALAWWNRPLNALAPGDDEGRELLECAARLGVPVLTPVAGACEPTYREALAAPGRLVASCGVDASACGALGVASWRVSPLEAVALLCGAPITAPLLAIADLRLLGSLPPGVGGIDAALELARRTDARRWAGLGVEVNGAGVTGLGVAERVALARTLVHAGAAFVLLPADEVTRECMKAWGRDADWREVRAVAAAESSATVSLELDLDGLEPLVSPGSDLSLARPLRYVLDHPLRGVALGPYADEGDIAVWLARYERHTVAAGLEVAVVPGTEWLASALNTGGATEALAHSGVAVRDSLASLELTRGATGTRLGLGRASGESREADWWLANPEVCAASALRGALCDPRDGEHAAVRRARLVRGAAARPASPASPSAEPSSPASLNYAAVAPAAQGSLRAVVWLVVGDDWPAERIVSRSARGQRALLEDPVAGLFPGLDRQWIAQTGPDARGAIIAGRHFGGGEFANEAAWALRRAGVAVVLAKSFAPECAQAFGHAGILALEAGRRPLPEFAAAGEELEVPSLPEAVEPGHPVGVRNLTRGVQDTLHHGLDAAAVAVWRAGGLLSRRESAVV